MNYFCTAIVANRIGPSNGNCALRLFSVLQEIHMDVKLLLLMLVPQFLFGSSLLISELTDG
jgi:hypothetical protein